MHIKDMKYSEANFYLILSLLTVGLAVAILIFDSVSFYEIKYGRDLVFLGTSKYLLSAAVVSCAGGFALISKDKRRREPLLNDSHLYLLPFGLAMILAILAYVFEAGILG
jgi:hypothetical protein